MEQEAAHCSRSKCLSKEFLQPLISRNHPEVSGKKVSSPRSSEGIEIIYVFQSLVELLTPSGTVFKTDQDKKPGSGPLSYSYMPKAPVLSLNRGVLVLTKIVPVIERTFEDATPEKSEPLVSELVDYRGEKYIYYNTIEDDHNSNFTVLANDKGVDLKHCLAFMRFLAVFHASSIPALMQTPQDISDIPLVSRKKACELNEDVIRASLAGVIELLNSWEDGQKWAKKINKLSAHLATRYADALRRQPDRFRVLVHGSPSGERVLFRDDPEKPVCSVGLRGFESSRFGSFADDVLHFIYRAAGDDVLESHTDLLVEEYRTAFNEALGLLGLEEEKLSPEDVRQELHAQRAVALVIAFHELRHVRAPDLDEKTPGETHDVVYKSPEYTKLLRMLLPVFDARGWLDGSDDTSAVDQVPDSSLPTT